MLYKNPCTIIAKNIEESFYLIGKDKNAIVKKYIIASGKIEAPSPLDTWKK